MNRSLDVHPARSFATLIASGTTPHSILSRLAARSVQN